MLQTISRILVFNLVLSLMFVAVLASLWRAPTQAMLIYNFAISFTYSTTIGVLCWYVLPQIGPKIAQHAGWKWLYLTGALVVLSLAGGTIAFGILRAFSMNVSYGPSMLICLVLTMAIGMASFAVEESRRRLEATTLELRTRELERERALKAASEAKLQSLESRIHPHFLFNTLNSISSLVRSKPEAAEALIERLAELLRFSLDRHGSLVSLEDELRVTRDYLEIERARFGERLQYVFDVEAGLESVLVPALSLQTLAENSVKYAVSVRREGAEIRLVARRNTGGVQFEITDSGPGFAPESLPVGHGLDTLKQRLESFFGDKAVLTARRLEPGMEVAFRIPC